MIEPFAVPPITSCSCAIPVTIFPVKGLDKTHHLSEVRPLKDRTIMPVDDASYTRHGVVPC